MKKELTFLSGSCYKRPKATNILQFLSLKNSEQLKCETFVIADDLLKKQSYFPF